MAGRNLLRSTTAGNHWTPNVLTAHNIQFHDASAEPCKFLGQSLSSLNHLDPAVFSSFATPLPLGMDPDVRRFCSHLRSVASECTGESSVDLFGMDIYGLMGYEADGFSTTIQPHTPLLMCGEKTEATPDVVLWHDKTQIYLILQEDKTADNRQSPVPQVVAEAIAAFQHNNTRRVNFGLPPLPAMDIPCVTMVRTRPTFLKVPVTEALSQAVIRGEYPETPTIVTSCSPPFPSPDLATDVGMDLVAYRRTCLQYYDAFREMAKKCWIHFIAGVEDIEPLLG